MIGYPASQRREYDMPDGTMSAVHFGRTSNPLKLIFLHATGFNGYAYKSILEPLGVHAMAIDMRGCGMTDLPKNERSLRSWHLFADDMVDFLSAHVNRPVVLAGHSSGAVISLLAAAKMADKVSGVVAFDPVTMPLLMRVWPYLPGGRYYMKKRASMIRNAGRRRAIFDSEQTVFERYVGRGTFKGVSDQALRDYIIGGFKPHAYGVELACSPSWEQAVFTAQGHDIFKATKNYLGPKHLIYAKKFGPHTKGTRRRMKRIVGSENFEFHEEFAHFFPLQYPDFAIGAMDAMIKKVALGG